MALRKIIQIDGQAFIKTSFGQVSLGPQKTAFTAYCKITNINGDKTAGNVTLECKDDNYLILKQFEVPFSVEENAPNFVKQAYLHIKSLPDWKDAVDC